MIQFLFLSLFIIITALALKPVADLTEKRMDELKKQLIQSLEDSIDYNLSYGSVSPSIFSFISIKNLVIYRDDERQDILAEVKSLRAYYSPLYFFTREKDVSPLQAISRFEIVNGRFNIDQTEDSKLIAAIFSGDGVESTPLLPLKTRFSGRKIDLNLNTSMGNLIARDVFYTLIPENEEYKTRLDGKIFLEDLDLEVPLESARAEISARGTIEQYFESFNFTVKSQDFHSNLLDMTDQNFQVISTTEGLEVRKIQDDSPIDLAMLYDRELDNLVFSFNAEKFRVDSLVTLKDTLKTYSPYLLSEVSGKGSLLFTNGMQDMVYSLQADINLNRDIFNRYVFLRSDLTGDLNQVNIRNLDLRTVEGRAVFTGQVEAENLFPTGRIRLVSITMPNGQDVNGSIKVSHESGFLHFTTDALNFGEQQFTSLDLVLFPDEESITASMRSSLGEGGLIVDSIVSLKEKPEISAFVNLEKIRVENILELLPQVPGLAMIPEEIENSELSSNFYLKTDLEKLETQVSRVEVQSLETEENQLTFSASYTPEGFKINNLLLNWDEYNLNGYVNSVIKDNEFKISTHFDLEDQPYRIEALYKEDHLVLEGDYGLYGFLSNTGKGAYSFTLNSRDLPLPIDQGLYYADLNLSGNIEGTDWNLFLDQTSVRTETLPLLFSPKLTVTADIDSGGADIYSIGYSDEQSSLKGLGRLSYSPGDISTWISLLDESGKTNEQYDLFLSMDGRDIESRLSIVASPLQRFRETGLGGDVSLDFLFSGSLDDPYFQAVVETERMTFNGVPVQISSQVQGDNSRVRISDLELSYNELMLNRGLVMLELEKGKLLATGAVNQVVNNSRASTSLTAMIESDHSFTLQQLSSIKEDDFRGKLIVAPITWDGMKTFPRIEADLQKSGPLMEGRVDQGKTLYASYDLLSGETVLNINDLFPLRLKASGSIKDSIINATVNDLVFYPSFINYFMPTELYRKKRHVIFTEGEITGDFSVNGPVTDPDFDGYLNMDGIVFESPYLAEVPEPVSAAVTLDGHSLVIEPFEIKLNKGVVAVDSSFEFDEGLPTTYNVDLEVSGSAGARIAYAIPGFSWDGHITGTSHIEGSRDGGFLVGDFICNDLVSWSESEAEIQPVPPKRGEPSINGFTVDLTVQTGRDVNFYLPNPQVPLIQATADNGDVFNIAYDSRSDVFALTGRVNIRTGEINYFSKTFYLQEGFIDLNESQEKFNPRLNVRADVVSKDDLGEDVTISLLFDDYLLNEFDPEFLSFPRKTENEILALLGQSFIPSNDPEQVSVASLIVATGGMIGKNTIMQPFEEAIKSSLDLDFVSFNTNIIENAILDRFQDQSLYEEGPQEMNFARYLKDTSLFVGEYIGDYLFLEGSLVVDYDESHSVSSTMGGLELNVNLNLQFITPFVLIDWTYNPKNNPNSDYFFPQNTISFTWQYSY